MTDSPPSHRIIDRRGVQAPEAESYGQLFQTPVNTGNQDLYRPRPFFTTDTNGTLNQYDWQELISYSRQIFAQIGNIGAGVVQKNTYAVGQAWIPQYTGRNIAWGEAAEEWLHGEWMPNCDIRGGVFDYHSQLFLSGLAYDIDGDDAVILTEDDAGFPKLKFCDALTIGSGGETEVKGGTYDGAKMVNGIIMDREGSCVALRINGVDVPAASAQLLFEPEWRTFCRGVPRLARSILDAFDVQDIDHYLKISVKQDSEKGILIWNEKGRAEAAQNWIGARPGATADNASDIKRETRMGGGYFYMRAGSGEKMEPFRSDRPHPNTEAFVQRIERRVFSALGWFYELLNPTDNRGANVRMIQDQARHAVMRRQSTIARRAKRIVQYAVSKGMENGYIPRNRDGLDFLRWDFERPAQLTVDAGYDEQADRENYRMGSTTLHKISQKKGAFWMDLRAQRARENSNLIDHAVDLVTYASAKGQKLTLREALDMMQRDSQAQRIEPGSQQPDDPMPAQ